MVSTVAYVNPIATAKKSGSSALQIRQNDAAAAAGCYSGTEYSSAWSSACCPAGCPTPSCHSCSPLSECCSILMKLCDGAD
jgi:hypothetical protein